MSSRPRTLYEKIWDAHVVERREDGTCLIYIDRHLVHEVTSPQAFEGLRVAGRRVRRPDLTLAVPDHNVATTPRLDASGNRLPILDPDSAQQLSALERNVAEFGIPYINDIAAEQGIVHVVGPEQGFTLPGTTVVCGDSHTSAHGALGALAFGIGTTEVGQVLATQCLLQRRPKTMAVEIGGKLGDGVTAKDLILAIIGKIGVSGGTGYVIEYRGPAIEALSMDERMTICNMSIEAGARAGMIAPDETTFAYLKGRRMAPHGADWDRAVERWRQLKTDPGARFDHVVHIDANDLQPMITYGTHPGMVVPIDGRVPVRPDDAVHAKSLAYMGLTGGERLLGKSIQVVFVGSCTNGRLSDLQLAARVLKGHKVARGVRVLIVPGSQQIKREAEALGLAKIFTDAGAEWRESGCSMCIGMNGDLVEQGQYSVSTSNRNFEGRQGKGARTLLVSPATAAAAAITGRVTDPRDFLNAPQAGVTAKVASHS